MLCAVVKANLPTSLTNSTSSHELPQAAVSGQVGVDPSERRQVFALRNTLSEFEKQELAWLSYALLTNTNSSSLVSPSPSPSPSPNNQSFPHTPPLPAFTKKQCPMMTFNKNPKKSMNFFVLFFFPPLQLRCRHGHVDVARGCWDRNSEPASSGGGGAVEKQAMLDTLEAQIEHVEETIRELRDGSAGEKGTVHVMNKIGEFLGSF